MTFQVWQLFWEGTGGDDKKNLRFPIAVSVVYVTIFILSILQPIGWSWAIICLILGTLARVIGHSQESTVPPVSFSHSVRTDPHFGPIKETPYFTAAIFAIPICGGAEFMSGTPTRLPYDFYTRFEEDIFGLPTKKLNEQVKDFLNDGLDPKVKEIRALSILGPGHHYNADDTIPPNWKMFFVGNFSP